MNATTVIAEVAKNDPKFWSNTLYLAAFVATMAYLQVQWVLTNYSTTLTSKTNKDAIILDRLDERIENYETRLTVLQEVLVKGQAAHEKEMRSIQNDTRDMQRDQTRLITDLATTEHKLNSATAAHLRQEVVGGTHWGKKLKELKELSKAADERERAWLRVVAYSPV